jgi:hypothetical protein
LYRDPNGAARCAVYPDVGLPSLLPSALDLWAFTDGSFEYGRQTRGTDQLAIALIYNATLSEDLAFHHWHAFSEGVLAKAPLEGGMLTEEWVLRWLLFCHAMTLSIPINVRLVHAGWEDSHERN